MSKLLINESPIMIQPTLVMKLGLNQAIIIQQLHYWLVKSPHIKDGKRRNTGNTGTVLAFHFYPMMVFAV
ncbi:MAG: hypothetical protein WAM95_14335 [Bacillus sp. (in: firmicutes)]